MGTQENNVGFFLKNDASTICLNSTTTLTPLNNGADNIIPAGTR